jgi:hypothetical protein
MLIVVTCRANSLLWDEALPAGKVERPIDEGLGVERELHLVRS